MAFNVQLIISRYKGGYFFILNKLPGFNLIGAVIYWKGKPVLLAGKYSIWSMGKWKRKGCFFMGWYHLQVIKKVIDIKKSRRTKGGIF